MNTKRKLSLSGNWWSPIRNFEFVSPHDLSDTLNRLKSKDFTNYTYVHIDHKKIDREYTFTWRTSVGKNTHIFIEGDITSDSDGDVTVRGRAIIGDLIVLAIFFCTHFLFMGIVFLVMLFQTHERAALFMALFPLAYIVMYGLMIRQRETQFDEFLTTVQDEKVKIKNGAHA